MVLLAVGSFVGALALLAGRLVGGAGFVPVSDRSEIEHARRDAAGLATSEYTRLKAEEARALARDAPGGALHLHDPRYAACRCTARAWTRRYLRAARCPRRERSIEPGRARAQMLRDELKQRRRRDGLRVHQRLRRGHASRFSSSCAGRTPRRSPRWPQQRRGRGAEGAGRGGRRSLHQGPEARARGGAQPRRSPARSA